MMVRNNRSLFLLSLGWISKYRINLAIIATG